MRSFFRIVLTMLAGALVVSAWPSSAAAQKRVALVVGKSAYQHAPRLANPKNDAEEVSAAFSRLGYSVIAAFDLDKVAFDRTLQQFRTALRGADLGVLFYSGHGVQLTGRNYLVPIDAQN